MLKINFTALNHNVRLIKQFAPNSKILAMVKDNAYGHSLEEISMALMNDVHAFGVYNLAEACKLRSLQIKKKIVLMQGFTHSDQIDLIQKQQLTPIIHHLSQLKILQQAKITTSFSVWLKIDVGMHRLGFSLEELPEILSILNKLPVHLRCVLAHLASAGLGDDESVKQEYNQFQLALALFPPDVEKSLANSAAILHYPYTHFDWVRPGLSMYGVSPRSEAKGVDYGFIPVMTLYGYLIAIRQCKKGDCLGYLPSYVLVEDTLIGVVNCGYADGYPFQFKQAKVLVEGVLCPVLGRSTSDAITIDLSAMKSVSIGCEVILWGAQLPIENVARWGNTIADKLLCDANHSYKKCNYSCAKTKSGKSYG